MLMTRSMVARISSFSIRGKACFFGCGGGELIATIHGDDYGAGVLRLVHKDYVLGL